MVKTMQQVITWAVLAVYLVAMLIAGIVGAKKANTLTNFVVGGRKAGPWVSAFGFGTAYFSAVLFIGYAGKSGYDFGLWAILIGVGNAVFGAYLAWKVLGNRTREVTRRLKIKTMPQFFEKRFDSKGLKIFAVLIIFIFMTPYSASVYSGLGYLCDNVLQIGYNNAMILIAVVAAIYVVLGGFISSMIADFIQGLIMIVGVVAMIFCIANTQEVGGFAEGFARMGNVMTQNGLYPPNLKTIVGVGSLIILTSFGTWGMPQMVQKFYGIETKEGVKRATVISTTFAALISCGAYFVGSLSRLFFTEVPQLDGKVNYDLIIPMILSKLPVVLLAVILVLVLAASVSTLSGITLTSCSAVAMDFIVSVFKPDMDRKKTLLLTRVLCLLFIICSYLLATMKSPILTLMAFSWGTICATLLPSYLLGLYWKRMNKTASTWSMCIGLLTSLGLAIFSGFQSGNAPLFGIIATAVSFLTCFIVTMVTKPHEDNTKFFLEAAEENSAN